MAKGRPREFNQDKALERATGVFWRRGYEGASLPELTRAMGINRPSMYAAFGNKESLFRKAVERYTQARACYVKEAAAEPTARGVAEKLLAGAIELMACPKSPRGCLIVQGALACGSDAEPIRKELARYRSLTEEILRERFERADDLPAGTEPAQLAKYLATVLHGMAVQSSSGASVEELKRVADVTLRLWA